MLARYDRVLCPEMNTGQLRMLLRARYLVDVQGLNKIEGQPFRVREVLTRIQEMLQSTPSLDPGRLEQETAMLMQRLDVAEELDRLETHIEEVLRVLAREKVAGRRLDFLMQELNREANTLASKSQDLDTTRLTVDMKVLIEQMREQVQNVE